MNSSGQTTHSGARNDSALWQLAGPLVVRCWSGDYVAYSVLSGNTHLLDILSGTILGEIAAGPALETRLRRLAAEFIDVPDDERLAQHVAATLATLDELGLVERA